MKEEREKKEGWEVEVGEKRWAWGDDVKVGGDVVRSSETQASIWIDSTTLHASRGEAKHSKMRSRSILGHHYCQFWILGSHCRDCSGP